MARMEEESIFKLIEEGPRGYSAADYSPTQDRTVGIGQGSRVSNVDARKIRMANPLAVPPEAMKKPEPVGFQGYGVAHNNSSQVANFLNPVNGIRDVQKRMGIAPRDHARNNLKAIRDASHRNSLKKQLAAQTPPKRPAGAVPRSNRPVGDGASSYAASNYDPASPGKRSGVGGSNAENNGRDFVSENKAEASERRAAPPPKKPLPKISDEPARGTHDDFGKVPSYLRERKQELSDIAAHKRAMEAAKEVPEGMMLLDEQERLATLAKLQNTKVEVEGDLTRLPFNIETPSQIRHKTGLESRLKEIEEAIKVFSRKVVYVRKD